MILLNNKTPQVEFDNIHAFIIAGMSTKKAGLIKVSGYGAISINDEDANHFYIVRFTSVPSNRKPFGNYRGLGHHPRSVGGRADVRATEEV